MVHLMGSRLNGTPNGIRTRAAALKRRFSRLFDLGFWHDPSVKCPTGAGPCQPALAKGCHVGRRGQAPRPSSEPKATPGPDERAELKALMAQGPPHLPKSRQYILDEAENLFGDLPPETTELP